MPAPSICKRTGFLPNIAGTEDGSPPHAKIKLRKFSEDTISVSTLSSAPAKIMTNFRHEK
jgi:hypothetical protein